MLQHTQRVGQPEGATKPKRKPVRRDPEKRRQQNLQAQRKYREKLRERLDRLEGLAQIAAQNRGIEAPLPTVDTRSTKPGEASIDALPITSAATLHPTTGSLPACVAPKISIPDLLTATLGDYAQLSSHPYGAPTTLPIWGPALNETQLDPSSLSVWDTGYISQANTCSTTAIQYPTSQVSPLSDTLPELSFSNSTTVASQSESASSGPSSTGSPSHVDPALIFRDDNKSGPCWTTTLKCSCVRPHMVIQHSRPNSFSSGDSKIIRFEPSPPVANPYVNNLRIDTLCTISAICLLSEHVGITEEAICFDDSISPFFRYDAEFADAAAQTSIVNMVRGSYRTSLKPDLRPNKEQITVKHHPYIDILPFPELRKNLITRTEDYDEDEFFHDLLFGLVCWGNAGVGKRDRNVSTGYASTGMPWDVRSWEGHEWFLKKYWSLFGGEEGELPRQTEWWRGIRGDEPLNVEEVS
ncbi:hypothetical protein ASPCAL06598 [Aspergillus calidoustus]|uniref:BZIP domain-containing protein n=1 Tax=Aspergillus calidoustus TaxID=454130 RepID=A0A0U5C989_ASPCI|nr:hypothetical protein ASPCAL06598 [Aspergillus calidoustus]